MSTTLAVITGGGTGLGRAQALALASAGLTVIIAGRREDPLKEVQNQIGDDKCHIVPETDIGNPGSWKRIIAKIEELGGELHYLSNCAGFEGAFGPTTYDQLNTEDIINYNSTYLTSTQLAYHFLAPYLSNGSKTRGKPSVVTNFSSLAGILPIALANLCSQYTPCKVAIEAITRCSHMMYKDQGVLSYALNPGVYESHMARTAAAQMGITDIEVQARNFNPIPLVGKPEHVGEIAVALFKNEHDMQSGSHYTIIPFTENESILTDCSKFRLHLDSMDPGILFKIFSEIDRAFTTDGLVLSDEKLQAFCSAVRANMAKMEAA